MHLQAQIWNQVAKALPIGEIDTTAFHHFGEAIAIDGNYAVAAIEDYVQNTGIAYVYYYNGSNWIKQANLTVYGGGSTLFGHTVSISGDVIVVGAPFGSAAYVYKKPIGGWVDMTETAKLTASPLIANSSFGNSVSISGDVIVVGATTDTINNIITGTAYVYVKPPTGWVTMTQTAKIKTSDGDLYDNFGESLSISGDNIVVGASLDDDNGNASGSAYVFTKPVTGWINMTQTAKIKPSDGSADDNFGTSVCIAGNNIVVGSPSDDDNGLQSGSAYIFTKPVSGWINMTQTAKIKPSDGANNDIFGCSVSISVDNIVIGANQNKNNNIRTGSAYIFEKPLGGWVNMTQTSKIISSDGVAQDVFGCSVCNSGNNVMVGAISNDAIYLTSGAVYTYTKPLTGWINMTENYKILPTLYYGAINYNFGKSVAIDGNYAVVGAPGYYNNRGAAFVLYKNGGTWTTLAKLTVSNGYSNNYFGYSVGISGNTIIVGAYGVNNNYGAVYVFTKPVSGWVNMTETAKLTASDAYLDFKFGKTISISGDNVVAGNEIDDDYGVSSGSAYIFTKPVSGWVNMTQTAKIFPSDITSSIRFGNSVSISGDDVVVGAYWAYVNGLNPGAAYVFTKPVSGWVNTMTHTAKLIASDGANSDYFGNSVSISGDNIVIGAYQDDYPQTNSGSAYVFTKPITGWANMTQTAKIKSSDLAINDNFGYSVSILGDNIVVGTYLDSDNGPASGSAYIFTKPFSGWVNMTQTAKIKPADGYTNDYFGYAVGISGNNVISGSYLDDDFSSASGSAYIFSNCANLGLTVVGNTITSLASSATYQWLNCNNNYAIIAGDTNQSYTPTTSGNFAVEVNQNGCVDTSLCTNIVIVGIADNINLQNITIHPNPAANILYIDGLANTATAEVYDISGKLLLSKQLNENQIDISSLAKGLYFIKLSTAEGSVVRKFVKE
jgi:hypothetical protein